MYNPKKDESSNELASSVPADNNKELPQEINDEKRGSNGTDNPVFHGEETSTSL